MGNAREEILSRIGSALGPQSKIPAPTRGDSMAAAVVKRTPERDELIRALGNELSRVRANVYSARDADSAGEVVLEIARRCNAKKLIGWGNSSLHDLGLVSRLTGAGLEVLLDDGSAGAEEFRSFAGSADVGLTGVDFAVADTGSLVVVSGKGRARSASLLPPVHVAIVPVDRIVPGLQDVFASLASGSAAGLNSTVTFITGPSRTADIELTLVVGVHGPQVLSVVIVGTE